MPRFIFSLYFLTLLSNWTLFPLNAAYGHSFALSGQVSSSTDSQPLAGVQVILESYSSPARSHDAVSQSDGRFSFGKIKEGLYRLSLSHVGYQTLVMDSIHCYASRMDLGKLSLLAYSQTLNEVVIRTKKPVIHYESDRFRVDVQAMNTRGDQALDLLQRIPGVKLEQSGDLSLQGKMNVLVYINGKQSYLTGSALLSYLKSLPAGDMASIDFLPTPPSSYDAAGSGGVIDIHLNQRNEDGYSVNTSLSITPLARTRSGLSTMTTIRKGRWQGYGQWGADYSPSFEIETTNRQTQEHRMDQVSQQLARPRGFSSLMGLSYQRSLHEVIGLDGKLMQQWTTRQTESQLSQAGSITSVHVNRQDNHQSQAQSEALHAFYKRTLDTLGSTLTLDGDYYHIKSDQEDWFSNFYTMGSAPEFRFDSRQNLFRSSTLYAFKADWIKKTAFATLELGVKAGQVTNTNVVNQDSLLGSDQRPIVGYTNVFTYREHIQAVYLSLQKSFGPLDLKVGVRYEYTQGFDDTRQLVHHQYGYLFPSASLMVRPGTHQLTFSYRKSIIRPVYTNLNPFSYYSDSYTLQAGNPALKPALAQIAEFNYVVNNTRLLTVNYIYLKDATLDIFTYDPLRQVSESSPQSIGQLQTWYIATGQALQLNKSWSLSTDLAVLYNRISTPLHQAQWNWTAQLNSDWPLKKGWSAWLLLKYASPSLYELSRVFSVGTASAGIKKMVMKGKGFVTVEGSDLFYSDRYKTSYDYQNIQQETLKKWQSRILRLTLNYTFGRSQVTLTNKRDVSPDEMERLK